MHSFELTFDLDIQQQCYYYYDGLDDSGYEPKNKISKDPKITRGNPKK